MSQTYLGIDVGKSKLHLALLLPNGKSKPKVIPNTPEGHQELLTGKVIDAHTLLLSRALQIAA